MFLQVPVEVIMSGACEEPFILPELSTQFEVVLDPETGILNLEPSKADSGIDISVSTLINH